MCSGADSQTRVSELGALREAIERLRLRPRGEKTPRELGEELVELRHACDLLELEFATRAADFADTDEYDRQGSTSPVDWIRHACRMSDHFASSAVCVGRHAPNLPHATEAVVEGRIGYAHLALMASTARALDDAGSSATVAVEPLLARALEHSVSRFRFDCAHARHAADAKQFLAEHVNAVECRRLELLPCDGGAVALRGIFDAAGGASLRTALEPLARRSGAHDDRKRDRRLADALVELAAHCLDTGGLPQRAGQRPHLQVTTTLETLMGAAGAPAGDLEFATTPIPSATVQRLACDASVSRVLLGTTRCCSMSVVPDGCPAHRPAVRLRYATASASGPAATAAHPGPWRTTTFIGPMAAPPTWRI